MQLLVLDRYALYGLADDRCHIAFGALVMVLECCLKHKHLQVLEICGSFLEWGKFSLSSHTSILVSPETSQALQFLQALLWCVVPKTCPLAALFLCPLLLEYC